MRLFAGTRIWKKSCPDEMAGAAENDIQMDPVSVAVPMVALSTGTQATHGHVATRPVSAQVREVQRRYKIRFENFTRGLELIIKVFKIWYAFACAAV
jgi:hypothetical protein